MSVKKIRVGVIGLGIGWTHAQAFAGHASCELAALCDVSQERLNDASLAFPGVALTTSDHEILTNPEIDLVVVASYDDHHCRQTVAALANSKHVLVEKPLCLHEREALAIRSKLAQSPGVRLSANLSLRTCPQFASVRNAVRSGEMGSVYSLEGDYLWGRRHKLTHGWRKDVAEYSIIHGAAIHMIDLLLWISGQRAVEVHAYGNRICTSGSGLGVNDYASINLLFGDGSIGRVTANGGCVHPHFHALSVFGTEKTFVHGLSGAEWIVASGDGHERIPCSEAYPAREARRRIIDTFVDAILDGSQKPLVDEDAVFNAMSVCFAAERSVRLGRPIAVQHL